MGKGDLELQKNQQMHFQDAEDVINGPDIAQMMDRPVELDYKDPKTAMHGVRDSLVNREIKRRVKKDETDTFKFEMNLVMKNPDAVTEENEKKWVREEMDKLIKKSEKKHILPVEAKPEEQVNIIKEDADKEKKKQRAENQTKENSARIRLLANDTWDLSGERLNVKIPKNTVLKLSYGSAFSSRLSDKKRSEKKKNVKSRLYQKVKNAQLLRENIQIDNALVNKQRAEAFKNFKAQIDVSDFNDLSQFMYKKDAKQNKVLANLFLAEKTDDGKRKTNANHARLALVKISGMLLSINTEGLKFDTDHDIAANAHILEKITNQVAAFDRLSEKYNFLESLEADRKEILTEKLTKLRSIAAYYTVRKSIMTNKEYIDHYDDELSMDITKANTDEQKALAEDLIRSLILGKEMMRINGVTVKNLNKLKTPKFKDPSAKQKFLDVSKKLKNTQNLSTLIRQTYSQYDEKASDDLDEINQVPAMREELNESIVDYTETGFADDELRFLLTNEELIPLKGTREYSAVNRNIQAVSALLGNQMPSFKVDNAGKIDPDAEKHIKDEIDGTCIAVTMQYKRLIESIEKLNRKYSSGYSELSSILTQLSDRCKKDSELFREKTLEYRDIAGTDPELINKPLTYLDALKFCRGIFYDVDNDKSITVTKDGAGASVVYKITKKVPVSEDNPKGKQIVYFREKDSVPSDDNGEMITDALKKYDISKNASKTIYNAFMELHERWNVEKRGVFTNKIREFKRNKATNNEIVAYTVKFFNKHLNNSIETNEVPVDLMADIIVNIRDTMAKRCMANRMKVGARIENKRNLSDRNVATSRLATILGIQDMVCDSRTAVIRMNGKVIEGNLMENSGGIETLEKSAAYSPEAISQLLMLNVFDFLCGQTDRHFGNYHGIYKNGKIVAIRCLDNDLSFGRIKAQHLDGKTYNRIQKIGTSEIVALPVSFANRILALSPAYLKQVLGDILNQEELDHLWDRLTCIKNKITSLPLYRADAKFDDKTNTISYEGEDSDDQLRQLKYVDTFKDKMRIMRQEAGTHSKFLSDCLKKTDVKDMIRNRRNELNDDKGRVV